MLVSPDGEHVYVTGYQDAAVAVFTRDAGTGQLDFIAVYKDTSLVGSAEGLLGASALAQSPDGAHVYVAGSSDDAIAHFERDDNELSPTFGELTFVAAWVDGQAGVEGLNGVQALAMRSDGKHLYVASPVDKAVAAFARNASTGALTFVGSLRTTSTGSTA